jgi:hypothetical protein
MNVLRDLLASLPAAAELTLMSSTPGKKEAKTSENDSGFAAERTQSHVPQALG